MLVHYFLQMSIISILYLILTSIFNFFLNHLPAAPTLFHTLDQLYILLGCPLLTSKIRPEIIQVSLSDLLRISVCILQKMYLENINIFVSTVVRIIQPTIWVSFLTFDSNSFFLSSPFPPNFPHSWNPQTHSCTRIFYSFQIYDCFWFTSCCWCVDRTECLVISLVREVWDRVWAEGGWNLGQKRRNCLLLGF